MLETTPPRLIRRRDGRRSRPSASVIRRGLLTCTLVLGFASAGTIFAGQSKVDICHINGQGQFQLITIADPAYATHIAHGDKAVETYYIDADGDGSGSPSMTVQGCTVPVGFVRDNTDCDDTDAAVNPGVVEIANNGIDDDCNLATPDTPPVVCPCEGITTDLTTWSSDITVSECYANPWAVTVRPGDLNGALQVFSDSTTGNPDDMRCLVPSNISIHVTVAEADACRASLLSIIAEDGITCGY